MDQEDEQILNFLNAPSSPESSAEDAALNILSITDTALRALHDNNRVEIPTHEADDNNHLQNESGSRSESPPSSTACDVLIRNTNVQLPAREVDSIRTPEPREGEADNDSVISDLRSHSVLSDSIDASFTGAHVKKVKIATKRLREIDSPLETRSPSPPTKDDSPEPRPAPSLPQTRMAPSVRRKAPSPPTREAPSPPVRDDPRLPQGRLARTSQDVAADACKMNLSEPSVVSYDVDTVPTRLGAEMVTRAESTVSIQSVGSSASARSVTMDASVYPSSRLDDVSSASSDVMTVPENLVTLDGLRQYYWSTSTLDEDVRTATSSWPRKLVGGRLVQGTRVQAPGLSAADDTLMSRDAMMTSQEEISVSQYDCSGKEQVVRDVLKRKKDQSKPTRRVVQARIVSSQAGHNNTTDRASDAGYGYGSVGAGRPDSTSGTQEAITAAVAASAAVAITQPYAKAQQELDAKMSEVLNQINSVRETERDSLTSKDRERIEELERQLADLTQKRLDYMEKMQQHHMEWQNKMLTVPRTCVMQRDHYEPVSVRRPDVPVCVTQAGRPYASMNDLDRDYPVPRAADNVRTEAGRGKLLEEILTQAKLDRRDVMTSPVASSAGRYGLESKPSTPVYASKSHGVSEYVSDKLAKANVGPTPLDGYLRKPTDVIPTSPYPALGDGRRRESIETYNLTQVEAVLQTLSKNKECLEHNFQTLLKAKNDADVYNIVDCIASESVGAEVARRRRMVDDCIAHLSGEVKSMVEEDLNQERLAKEREEQGIVIEEKKPLKKPRFGGRVQPRIDSGIRRVEAPKDVRGGNKGKENVPARKAAKPPAKPAAPPVYTDENYLTKVYGKASYHNKRTTVKNPYLHYNNPVSPPNKATRPVVTQDVKAIALKSARTQTAAPPAPRRPPPGQQQPPVSYITVQGHQVPVAISLGPPRQGGTKEAVVVRTGAKQSDHETKLEVKVLPSVDIDSEARTAAPEKTRLERMVHDARDRRLNDYPDTGVDTVGRGLILPGYHPPTPDAYMGPAYPPENVQPQYPIPEDSSARELAEALRQRDLLQNRARDWIEQELMARLLLERQKLREDRPRDPVPHQVPSMSPQTSVEDETAGVLNNRGVQMFVDSGLPVNEGLVKKLIGDVIKERLRNTMGTNQRPRTKPVTSPRKTTSPRRQKSRESSRKEEGGRNGADASLNISSINSSPPKIMSPLDANHTARSSMVTESESESTNELAAIWGKKPVLTIEEEENSVLQYSQKRDDTPVPSGSEVWEYEDDFPQTPQSERQQTVSQAPSTPSTPGATPGPGQKADDEPVRRSAESTRRSADGDVRISVTSREPSPPSSPRKGRGSRGRTPRPEMDEIAVQTELPPSPTPSSLSPSSTMVTDTFNESLSEGEWLISHSEGQAPDVDPVRRMALLQYLGDDEPSIAVSVEIPQDEHYQGFLNRSVGEFVRPRITPDRPPNLIQYLSQIRPPVHPLQRFSRPDVYPSPVHPRLETQKSLGELVAEGDLLLEQHEYHEDDPLRLSELRRPSEPRPESDAFPPRPASLQSTPAPSDVKSSDAKSSDTPARTVVRSSDTQGRIDDVASDVVVPVVPVAHPRIIYVRSSRDDDDDDGVDDTMRNVQGTLASSLGQVDIEHGGRPDTRTPDQMNVDGLRGSDYLTQTFSDSEQQQQQQQQQRRRQQEERENERRAVIGHSDERRTVIGQSIDQGNLSTLRSSFGGTGQFTVTESLEEGQALFRSSMDAEPERRPAGQGGQVVVRMPSAGDQSETETAEDISEISIT